MFQRRARRQAGMDGASVPAAPHLARCQPDTPPAKTHRLGAWLSGRGRVPAASSPGEGMSGWHRWNRAENPRGLHGGWVEVSFPRQRWRGVPRGLGGGALDTAHSRPQSGDPVHVEQKRKRGPDGLGEGVSSTGLAPRPWGRKTLETTGRWEQDEQQGGRAGWSSWASFNASLTPLNLGFSVCKRAAIIFTRRVTGDIMRGRKTGALCNCPADDHVAVITWT